MFFGKEKSDESDSIIDASPETFHLNYLKIGAAIERGFNGFCILHCPMHSALLFLISSPSIPTFKFNWYRSVDYSTI